MQQKDKVLVMIAGPNGSGKSSAIRNTNLIEDVDNILNPDNLVKHITWTDDIETKYVVSMKFYEVYIGTH